MGSINDKKDINSVTKVLKSNFLTRDNNRKI